MIRIVLGLIVEAIGGALISAAYSSTGMPIPLFLALLGIAAIFGGLILLLSGIREYMLGDVIDLLKILAGKQSKSKEYKKCAACAEMVRSGARLCKHCGNSEFLVDA